MQGAAARCLERCLRAGPPVQAETEPLLQSPRALGTAFRLLPSSPFPAAAATAQTVPLASSALGSSLRPCLAPWMSPCGKLAAHPWEERLPAPTRRSPLPEQKWPCLPQELEGAARRMLCFKVFKIFIISSLKLQAAAAAAARARCWLAASLPLQRFAGLIPVSRGACL